MGKRYLNRTPLALTYHLKEYLKKERPGPNLYPYLTIVEYLVPGPGLSTLFELPPLILTLPHFIEEKIKEQRY